MVGLPGFMRLELDVQGAMRLCIPGKDHHAAGDLVQAMDDKHLAKLLLQPFNYIV